MLQYVVSSHIWILCTYLLTQGSAPHTCHKEGPAPILSGTVHLLEKLSLIATFWYYCFIPHNEFQDEKEKRREKMNIYSKVWPTFSAHNEQEYYASILNATSSVFCKSIHKHECLL